MKRVKKRYIFSGIFILIIALVLFFLSSIVKNWIVKNSEELIGRKVEISELHFNYLKMSVKAIGVTVYETNKTDRFVSFHELFADFSPWKLLNHEYSLSEFRVDSLDANIIQTNTGFNFDDLITDNDSSSVAKQDTTNLKFSLYNVNITNGIIKYEDKTLKNKVELKNLNLSLPLIAWDQNQSDMGAKFNIGEQGTVEVAAEVNSQTHHYVFNVKTTDVSIQPVMPYLKDYADISSLDGLLTSEIQINGDMADLMNIVINGKGKLDNISVKDGHSEEIFKAEEVRGRIKELNLKTFHFGFTGVELDQPVVAAVLDKDMINLERFALPYLKSDTTQISSEEPETTYAIDTLIVKKGEILFTDNTLNRPFYSTVNDLNLTMYNLSDSSDHIPVIFSATLNDEGTIKGNTVFSMSEPMNFEFDGQLKKLNLINFSPYSEYYIASPITQGRFNYDLQIKMTPKWLKNENKIKIGKLEFGKRTADKPKYKVPLRLGLYILKDINDNIEIDLPVSGSTSDPHFKLGKLIWKTFTNLIIKTAASPFKALSGLAGKDPEKLEYLKFALTQDSLDQTQRSALSSLAKIMSKKPELMITMSQRTDEESEKAQLAVQLGKKKYEEARQKGMTQNSDTTFEAYLRQQVPEADSLGVEKACLRLITPGNVEQQFKSLLNHRNELVRNFFASQGLPEGTVQVSTSDLKTLPQELRRPEFKVEILLK